MIGWMTSYLQRRRCVSVEGGPGRTCNTLQAEDFDGEGNMSREHNRGVRQSLSLHVQIHRRGSCQHRQKDYLEQISLELSAAFEGLEASIPQYLD